MRSLDFDRIDHVYIRPGYTDLRKGIDGLCLLVQSSKGKIYIHNHTEPDLIRTVLDSL